MDQNSGGGEKRRKNLRNKEIRRKTGLWNEKGEGGDERAKLVIYGTEKGKRNSKSEAVESVAMTFGSTNV